MFRPDPDGRTHWPWFALAMAGVLLVFLPLHNGYWSPGNDAELYVAAARSLLRGEGYTFNGLPTDLAPPGWPLLLAGLMAISPTFFFLKLANLLMMAGALGVFYFVCRRFASPRASALAVVSAALLHPLYQLTFLLHAEASFMLATAVAILLAVRVGQGKGGWPATLVACGLLAWGVFTRYAGVFEWPIVAGAFLGPAALADWRTGRARAMLKSPRFWGVVISFALAAATLVGTMRAVHHFVARVEQEKRQAAEAGDESAAEELAQMDPLAMIRDEPLDDEQADAAGELGADGSVLPGGNTAHGNMWLGHGDRPIWLEYGLRGGRSGKWFSWLLWHPSQFGDSVLPVEVLAIITGFASAGLLLITVVAQIRRGRLLWLGLAAYVVTIAVIWPNVNNRYLVPVAPLIVLGVVMALRTLAARSRPGAGRAVALGLLGLFVGAVVVVNGVLWAKDVQVARSADYYGQFEGGDHASLIDVTAFLRELDAPPGSVGVSGRYQNLGRTKYSWFGTRAAVLLLDEPVKSVPRYRARRPQERDYEVRNYLATKNIRYYLYQRPHSPWRVWHFRLSPALHNRLSPDPALGKEGGWELFALDETAGRYRQVNVPEAKAWPTRVPGL